MNFTFNQLDLVFGIIIIVLSIRGLIRGFVNETLSMAAMILGVLAAVIFTKPVSDMINNLFGYSMWAQIIAFLAIFIIVYLLIKLIEGAIQNGIDKMNLEKLDKVLGFFLGFVEGVLIITVVIFIMQLQGIWDFRDLLNNSFIARILLPVIHTSKEALSWLNGGKNTLKYV